MFDGIKNFIFENSYKNRRNQKHHKIFNFIDLYIKDPLPENIDILEVIQGVEEKIPFHLVEKIDVFYIGEFKEFEEKQVNAMYRDGAIYITNHQDDLPDMVDDMIHEISHAIEDIYAEQLYADNKIQNEFIGKRKRLEDMLRQYGYLDGKELSFADIEHDQELDDFLYKELGYDKLDTFCTGLFIRSYAVTDIREYFATAFEEFILGDRAYVERLSPAVYRKISFLYKNGS